jgi:MFS family permease
VADDFGGATPAGWQWMFLIEGLPCLLLGVLALKLVPDRPADADWLTPTKSAARTGSGRARRAQAFVRRRGARPAIYVLAFAYFCVIAAIYALSFWLPTLIKAQGVTDTVQRLVHRPALRRRRHRHGLHGPPL